MNVVFAPGIVFLALIPLVLIVLIWHAARRQGGSSAAIAAGILVAIAIVFALMVFGLRAARVTTTSIHQRALIPNTSHIVQETGALVDVHPLAAPEATRPTSMPGKQWVDDWPVFFNTTHWNGFKVESSETCLTEAEAREEALAKAASNLTPIVYERARNSARRTLLRMDTAAQQVNSALRSGQTIADEYLQKTEKPYGILWKHYLLIDTSPLTLDPIVQRVVENSTTTAVTKAATWGSLAALAIVIVLVYAFLNAATRGYFVWRLRAAAVLVVIVAILVTLAIA